LLYKDNAREVPKFYKGNFLKNIKMVKPLKLAGIFGIILLVLAFISMLLSFLTVFGFGNSLKSSIESGGGLDSGLESFQQQAKLFLNISTIILLIAYLFSIGFLFGFVALGRRFNNKMLFVAAWILIVLAVLGFILTLGFYATGNLYPEGQTTQTSSTFGNLLKQKANRTPVMGAILNMFGDAGFWPLLIFFVVGGLTLKIIFGVGLYKLKKNDVALADWSGSFEIGSIILSFLGTLALILETIMFFKASKKFETENSQMSYQ